jgi:rod shape-determining protein MreD
MAPKRRNRSNYWWLMPTSLTVAVVLDMMPLPSGAAQYRPPWVTLLVIYWCLFEPRRAGPATGWIVGLVMDVLQFTLLGLNAFAKTIIAYLVGAFTKRVSIFSGTTQLACVALLVALDALVVSWIHGIIGNAQFGWRPFLPVITGTLVWPFLVAAMHNLRPLSMAH